jgi:hypothetical protein
MTVDDPGENIDEIAERIDFVEFTCLDQRCDGGPVVGAAVRASEQSIFPVELIESSRSGNKSEAMRAYAKQAKNKQLEVDASEIRFRAERRIGELMEAQNAAGLMNVGAKGNPGGQGAKIVRVENGPAQITLSEAGIDKHLADRARKYAAIPEDQFEEILSDHRDRIEKSTRPRGVNSLARSASAYLGAFRGTGC